MSGQRRVFMIGCSLAGAIGILALIVGLAVYQFNKYRTKAENLPEKGAPIMIAITDPQAGASTPAGTPLLVHVDAGSPQPLLSLELWVDGQIVAVQAAPQPNGIMPFAADFAWTPIEPGSHTIVARGLQAGDQSADSAGVVVIVEPTEKAAGGNGAEDSGQSIPISNGGGGGSTPLPQPPSLPADTDSIGPAQTWNLSFTDWFLGGSKGPPTAPEVIAAPNGCGATLSIHDLSDGEDGFIVFRMTQSAPMLTKIITLDGQSLLDWLTYTDESYTSENSYMVRAFKGTKVADSNIGFAKGNVEDCQSETFQLPQLSIQLTSLKADIHADMAYCYKSLNGANWTRWPVAGFFMPGADGFDIQGQADSIVLNELDAKSLTLDLECWGWVGGALQLLGKLHKDNVGPDLGPVQVTDGGLAVGLDVGGGLKPMDSSGGDKAPIDPKMPKVFAIIFFGPDSCFEHLAGKGNDGLENLLFCSWFPEYNQDQGESQPYLVWYVADPQYQECVNGEGEVCNSFQWYLNRASMYDGQVGFHVYDQHANWLTKVAIPYDRTVFVVPPQGTCGQDSVFYTVRMFYQGGPNDPDYPNQMVEGPDSNTVTSVLNCPAPSEVKLDVIFDSLHIADLGDGVGGYDDLEVYASFVAEGKNPGGGSVLNLGEWGWSGSSCASDVFAVAQGLDTNGVKECPTLVKEGDAPISDMVLCSSDTYSHCVGPYLNNNNKIQITVGDGSRIRVAVHMMDYDEDSPDDDVCHAETWIGPESVFGWQGFSMSGSMSQGDNGSASCIVDFHIVPSP